MVAFSKPFSGQHFLNKIVTQLFTLCTHTNLPDYSINSIPILGSQSFYLLLPFKVHMNDICTHHPSQHILIILTEKVSLNNQQKESPVKETYVRERIKTGVKL